MVLLRGRCLGVWPAASSPPLYWNADQGIFREQAQAAAAAAASAAARRGGNMINVKVHINDALTSQRAILMRPKMQTVLPTHRTCCIDGAGGGRSLPHGSMFHLAITRSGSSFGWLQNPRMEAWQRSL